MALPLGNRGSEYGGSVMTGMVNRGLAVAWCATLAITAGIAAIGCGPTYPNCDNDEQCHEGEFCVNGRCQDCRDDSQCPRGQRCTEGACEPTPGWCESDADCPSDRECVENFCRPRPVVSEETP